MVRSFVADGLTEDEVGALRDHELFSEAASFETSAEAASQYGGWLLVGQAPDMAVTRGDRLAQVTRDSVKVAAAHYLDPDHIRIVVVGDGAALKEPLAALGWGPVEMRGTDGAVMDKNGRGNPGVESLAKRR